MNSTVLILATALLPFVWGWLVHRAVCRYWHGHALCESARVSHAADIPRSQQHSAADYQI